MVREIERARERESKKKKKVHFQSKRLRFRLSQRVTPRNEALRENARAHCNAKCPTMSVAECTKLPRCQLGPVSLHFVLSKCMFVF